jgi:hypothetical protein
MTNVAASANGGYISATSGTLNGASPDSLIDGVFLPRSRQWQTGTVWWNGTAPYIEISFDDVYRVQAMSVQADDNDAYTMQYWDSGLASWQTAWNVPNYDAFGFGMQTRPNPSDNSEVFALPAPITTDKLRIMAASGDNSYSLSEVQAFATPVPLPAALPLFGAALLGLAGFVKRHS